MQKIDKHISELLYEHDCVIVPALGGFVGNYAPAKIHPTQHSFTPPSKNISFNTHLKNNDGLLASHIVTVEKTNYSDALKYIHEFVDSTNANLKKGEKVSIEDVGVLFLDVERNVQFQPSSTNFLLDAFGLSSFQSPAIKRDNITRRLEKEFKDRVAVAPARKKINYKRYVAIGIAAPLLAILVWIPLKTDLLKNINYSSLNPFSKKEIKMPEVKENNNTVAVLPVAKEITPAENTAEPVTNTTPPTTAEPVKADTTAVVKEQDNHLNFKFHLVVGCFQVESNAVNFVNSLNQQNLNASIIGKNNKDMFVVSCGDYSTNGEAAEALATLRKSQPNAWLYKN